MEAAANEEAEDDMDKSSMPNEKTSPKASSVGKDEDNKDDKGSQDGDLLEEENKAPPYTPLVPEMWQEKLKELSQLHVIKFRRLFQSLFYFLKFGSREAIC